MKEYVSLIIINTHIFFNLLVLVLENIA